jgi:hypothetical protein
MPHRRRCPDVRVFGVRLAMKSPEELRAAAERYRQMAGQFVDRQTVKALRELADEYEVTAERLEKVSCSCASAGK